MRDQPNIARERLVRTIRVDDSKVDEVLEKLDVAPGAVGRDRRAPRYRYRLKGLVIYLQQPGFSAPVPYLVPTRNISASGLSFLHGGYVHSKSRCLVKLVKSSGEWTNVMATVVRCRYIESNIHEVGIRFDQDLDPAQYRAEI